jgi:hypothetical protein
VAIFAFLENADASAKPPLFVVFVGAEARGAGGAAATRGGAFGRAQWLVALHMLWYSEGYAHIMWGGATCRMFSLRYPPSSSAADGSAAAARWPASAAAESALRDAMRAAVPRKIKQRASKAKRSVATVSRLRHPGIVPVECAFLDEDVVVGQLPRCTSALAAVRAAAMIGGGGTSCGLFGSRVACVGVSDSTLYEFEYADGSPTA